MNLRPLLPLLGLSFLLSGCGALLAPQNAPLTYRLQLDNAPQATTQARFPYTLQIAAPLSEAGFNTSAIAYRQQPYRLDYYTQSRWIDSPAALLGEQMTLALEQSGAYRAVLAPNVSLPSDLRLVTELITLEQVFTDSSTPPSGTSKVLFSLRMQLIDARNTTILASGRIDLAQLAPSADALGAVTAANQALSIAMPKIVQFCIENTPKTLSTPP
ncbi:MAG: ABC-type transport auxiliary lipoprotein family protein [Halothiobacillaceae bacterium]